MVGFAFLVGLEIGAASVEAVEIDDCAEAENAREGLDPCSVDATSETPRAKTESSQQTSPSVRGKELSELLLLQKISSVSSVQLPDDI
jgi:hypothetical protein